MLVHTSSETQMQALPSALHSVWCVLFKLSIQLLLRVGICCCACQLHWKGADQLQMLTCL